MTRPGLTGLTTEQLQDLMRYVHRGTLPCPFRRQTLLAMGLNAVADHGDLLIGLDAAGVRAVIAAVVAERRPRAL